MPPIVDPYCYPKTKILRNKFDLRTKKDLEKLEADFVALRLRELALNPVEGGFDFIHVCAIHEYIFQDIYDWAGKPRTINIEKPESLLGDASVIYANKEYIQPAFEGISREMRSHSWNHADIEDTIVRFSNFYARLWKIHPFREGNTRTITEYMCEFAQSIKLPLNRDLLQRNSEYLRLSLVAANAHMADLSDKSTPQYLRRIIGDAIHDPANPPAEDRQTATRTAQAE